MKNFIYDFSIIVPVYNNEKYIDKCLDSILNQNYDINKIQVILINDGSIDNSLNVLKKYIRKNISVIDKKNTGVSDTRNIGIKKALGKYILFLDSDDYISKNTCKKIYDLFEKNYNDIDLVTYPIIYDINGKLRKHPRYSTMFYKGTAVYDLEKDFNLIQATVNVCIKNNLDDNIYFETKQNFSEDERFSTEVLMKKKKIGFVKDATYYYRRHTGTANDTITNPYYSFETIMSYYEYLFDKYEENNIVPKYIQALYVNNLSWRIKQDVLYPYHYDRKEYEKSIKRINKLLSKVDESVITSLPYSDFYKVYLLNLKKEKIDTELNDNKYTIKCNDVVLENNNNITSLINKFKIKNNIIILNGYFKTVLFENVKPNIFIKLKRNNSFIEEKIDTFITNNSYYETNIKTNTIYGFRLKIDIKDLKEFQLYYKQNNITIPITYEFNRFSSNIIYDKKIRVSCYKNKFFIKRNSLVYKIKDSICNFIKYTLTNPRIELYRILGKMYYKKSEIWLYSDKGGLLDNAYIQFLHDIKINDGVKRYYVYNESLNKIKEKVGEKEQKYLLKFKSLKHKQLYLRCDKILTSFSDLQVYCPFNNGIKWYRDITKYDLVYLQHGILHANLVKMYAKEFTEIDKFIISTNFEYDNLINKYHYEKEDLILSGMPRMNNTNNNFKVKNKILFAPSWREYLIGKLVNNRRDLKKKEFLNSTFYKEIYNFLHSKELTTYLKKNDLILDFKLHPIFKDYKNLFDLKDVDNITLNFDKTNIYEYQIFITDFSSFQFDFVKLKRPIIYFMPDIKEFNAGLHTYRELDLKYEDAFGTLCLTSDELLKEMKKITKNKYAVDNKYAKRMDNFFIDIDKPTDKIYKEIKAK